MRFRAFCSTCRACTYHRRHGHRSVCLGHALRLPRLDAPLVVRVVYNRHPHLAPGPEGERARAG